MDSLAERTVQLLDELAHADGLIDRLVAENEQLRARVARQDRVIAALRSRAASGRGCRSSGAAVPRGLDGE